MANSTEIKVFNIIKPAVESLGVFLWNVEFIKEGASYYLRVYIDKKEGVDLETCTEVSHLIDPILDEYDPIDKSYYLEVCSAGLNRKLTREEHFLYLLGQEVVVNLYKAKNGIKKYTGLIENYSNDVLTLNVNGENILFNKSEISKVILNDDII